MKRFKAVPGKGIVASSNIKGSKRRSIKASTVDEIVPGYSEYDIQDAAYNYILSEIDGDINHRLTAESAADNALRAFIKECKQYEGLTISADEEAQLRPIFYDVADTEFSFDEDM